MPRVPRAMMEKSGEGRAARLGERQGGHHFRRNFNCALCRTVVPIQTGLAFTVRPCRVRRWIGRTHRIVEVGVYCAPPDNKSVMVKRDEFLPERVGECRVAVPPPPRRAVLLFWPRCHAFVGLSVRESSESAIAACPEHENCSPLRSVGGKEGVASL